MGASSGLVDTFGRRHTYLRISVTDRCDLRCRYCMPPEGIQLQPRSEILTIEEIIRLARLLVDEGVNKIRITGGEPMVRRGIDQLLHALGHLDGVKDLGITTNGVLLSDRMDMIRRAGVTQLNLSLDTWRRERFHQITLRDQFDAVRKTLDLALEARFQSLKLNCVVMRGINDDELLDFVSFTRENNIAVRFIEYMPFSGNGWDTNRLFPFREMLERIRDQYDLIPVEREHLSDTATRFRVPGFVGTLGFISSMTDHFCATCNRLRLTADGNIKNCLFDNGEIRLRDPMRAGAGDDALRELIQLSVRRKFAHHGGHETPELLALDPGRSMIQIGG